MTHPAPRTTSTWRSLGMTCLISAVWASDAWAFEARGDKTVWLHARDGSKTAVATVHFAPSDASGSTHFRLTMKPEPMKDHFLSMREFKCLDGKGEILCHVPYPYRQPGTVSPQDWAWLEHSLLFMFKLPSEFGAKLWNGIYFALKPMGGQLVGTPQAVDLNQIGAPPARLDVPPYPASKRDDIRADARWFNKLTVE